MKTRVIEALEVRGLPLDLINRDMIMCAGSEIRFMTKGQNTRGLHGYGDFIDHYALESEWFQTKFLMNNEWSDNMNEEEKIPLNKNNFMRIFESLEIGKEYAQEVLQNHLVTLGETTRKNKMTADLIRGDIEKMEFNIDNLKYDYQYLKKEKEDFDRRYG